MRANFVHPALNHQVNTTMLTPHAGNQKSLRNTKYHQKTQAENVHTPACHMIVEQSKTNSMGAP